MWRTARVSRNRGKGLDSRPVLFVLRDGGIVGTWKAARCGLRGSASARFGALVFLMFLLGWGAVAGRYRASEWWRNRQANRAIRQFLRANWDSLASGSSRPYAHDSPATLLEFSDYQCPYCRIASRSMDSLASASTIRLVYRHLPLKDIHAAAEGAARTAICAEAQGQFQAMHHHLMTRSEWQKDTQWTRVASAVGGIDTAQFAICLRSKATDRRLAEDEAYAKGLLIPGTPAFFTAEGIYTGRLDGVGISRRPAPNH